jgi:hypothetical protein
MFLPADVVPVPNTPCTSVLQWTGLADSRIGVGAGGGAIFWFGSSPAESCLELYADSATVAIFEPAIQLFCVSGAMGVIVY